MFLKNEKNEKEKKFIYAYMLQSKVLDHVGAFGVGSQGITCHQRLLLATSPIPTLS